MNKRILLSTILFLVSVVSYAQPKGFKEMKDTLLFKTRLNQVSKETKTIQSDFKQEKILGMLSEKITTEGHLDFRKENLLRWEYTKPFKYLIVLNNGKVMIKDEDKISKYDMKSNKMFKEINDMMLASVQGNVLDSKKFKINLYENEKYNMADLTPLLPEMKSYLQTIHVYFDKKDCTVSKFEMIESQDNSTMIDFYNKVINAEIPAEKFNISK